MKQRWTVIDSYTGEAIAVNISEKDAFEYDTRLYKIVPHAKAVQEKPLCYVKIRYTHHAGIPTKPYAETVAIWSFQDLIGLHPGGRL